MCFSCLLLILLLIILVLALFAKCHISAHCENDLLSILQQTPESQ